HIVGSVGGTCQDVDVSGSYAYVAAKTAGFRVVDISNPKAPQTAGVVDTPGLALGVAVSGDYAYVADDDGGFHVIDVRNPNNPHIAGTRNIPEAKGVAILRGHAYVASQGVRVINI